MDSRSASSPPPPPTPLLRINFPSRPAQGSRPRPSPSPLYSTNASSLAHASLVSFFTRGAASRPSITHFGLFSLLSFLIFTPRPCNRPSPRLRFLATLPLSLHLRGRQSRLAGRHDAINECVSDSGPLKKSMTRWALPTGSEKGRARPSVGRGRAEASSGRPSVGFTPPCHSTAYTRIGHGTAALQRRNRWKIDIGTGPQQTSMIAIAGNRLATVGRRRRRQDRQDHHRVHHLLVLLR